MTRPMKSPVRTPPEPDWLDKAKRAVEDAIDKLVVNFVSDPYLHRVEHSLHAHLFELMLRENENVGFAAQSDLHGGKYRSQAIHKEWPETNQREGKNGRGNFDLVVLSPAQLAAADPDEFRGGWIKPAIVIEMGLDYGLGHLHADHAKLKNSVVTAGYLVHFQRKGRQLDDEARNLINSSDPKIKTAYIYHHLSQDKITVKRTADPMVQGPLDAQAWLSGRTP